MVVFRKELVDTLRDRRSLVMAFLFGWLGPLLAAVLSYTVPQPGLLPAFLMVVAFTSAMPLAIDSMAGERERGSLEPLILTAVPPAELVVGKWLAIVTLSLAGVVLNLVCTAIAVHATPLGILPAPLCYGCSQP
jgi:ABC-type Na+ efflux pump permease subunit